jgi:hypothetical protein
VASGDWIVSRCRSNVADIFAVIAVALVAYGTALVVRIAASRWQSGAPRG